MAAKISLAMLAALVAVPGCAGGLKRLAPPGILKYEDLAKGEPTNPAIVARIESHKAEKAEGFPILSQQPDALPEGIAKPERDALEDNLLMQRDALNAAIAADRAEAAGERDEELELARDSLGAAVATDSAVAKDERKQPVTTPKPELKNN